MKPFARLLAVLCAIGLANDAANAQEIWSVRHVVDNDDIIFGINQATFGVPTGVGTGDGAPRDNRGVAVSKDGLYLYLGYNNPSAKRVVRRIALSELDPANNHTSVVNQVLFPTGGTPAKVPKAIATDDKGRVYIALGATIAVYSADLSTLRHTIPGFTLCEGVAVKRISGTLAVYATDRTDGTLERFVITEGAGEIITSSTKVGFDGDGEVTVTGNLNMRGLEVDDGGMAWIADINADKVLRVNSDGTMASSVSVADPIDVAINTAKGEVYVSQYTLRTVTVLKLASGAFDRTLTPPWAALQLNPTGESGTGAISGLDVFSGAAGEFLYAANETGNTSETGTPLDSPFSSTDDDQVFRDDDNDPIMQVQFVAPLLAYAGPDARICLGESITLGGTPAASGGVPPYTYSWTPPAGLNDPSAANPVATPGGTMAYTLTVTDHLGTMVSDMVTITVDKSSLLYCLSDEALLQLTSIRLDVMPMTKSLIANKIIYGGGAVIKGFAKGKPIKGDTEAAAYDPNTKTAYIISNRLNVSVLLRLDLKTGIAYGIGQTYTAAGVGIDDINAIAFNSKTNELYGIIAKTRRLIKINPSNARVTMIYPNPVTTKNGVDLEGASFDETVNPPVLYAISEHGKGEIFTVNLATGAGTEVGKTLLGMESIGFGKDGKMYGINHNNGGLYLLNRTTYAATLLAASPKVDGEGIIIEECAGLSKPNAAEQTLLDDDAAETATALPTDFVLEQNYPNPFSASGVFNNPSTVISLFLPEAGKATVHIYNTTGQLVRTLLDAEVATGRHLLQWNARDHSGKTVAAGVYLYRISVQRRDGATRFTETKRMTLLK